MAKARRELAVVQWAIPALTGGLPVLSSVHGEQQRPAPGVAPWLWAVLLIGTNCTYPLAIALITRSGGSERVALRWSGFVQTGGYVLAAAGPFAAGSLRQATGGWELPILVVLAAVVIQVLAGTLAGRTRPA